MNIRHFVIQNRLKPADAVVLRKKFMGMFSHYAIYLGEQNGEPQFSANFIEGVNIIPREKIESQLEVYKPERIERFKGNVVQRRSAIERAVSLIGQKTYNLLSNNCEHYKNIVHYGRAISEQVDNVGSGSLAIGSLMTVGGMVSSDKEMRNWGIGITILGALLKALAEPKTVKK